MLIATRPVDFRRGADGLAAMVQWVLGQDPFGGTIFVFRSKRADRVKILVDDGTGLVLIWKRLEGAKFKWPAISDGVMRLSRGAIGDIVRGAGLAAGVRPKDPTAAGSRLSLAFVLRALRHVDSPWLRITPCRRDEITPGVTMPDTLPDDVAALRALVLTAWAERDAERAEKGRLVEERDQLAGQNDRLRHLLRQVQRMQFGRRSEKLDPDQLTWPWNISNRQ